MTDPEVTRKLRRRGPALRPRDRVVFNGRKTTVTDAAVVVGYPVPLPDSPAASRANLDEVWVNDHRCAGLVFAGKITITMQPAIYPDPALRFELFTIENNVTAEVGRVHGEPALVITPNTDACKSNAAWVEFYRDGISIHIHSHHYGTATLLAVAESMR